MRIRTPPVRDASTKPSAATVLPAPVACSNQKRLSAFGSSGASPATSASTSLASSAQSCGSSSSVSPSSRPRPPRSSSSSSASSSPRPPGSPRKRVSRLCDRGGGTVPALAVIATVALRLGEQRGQRAGQGVDLVGGEHGAVDEMRLLLGEQPLEPEQQRELPAPVDRRHLRAVVELRERSVKRPAPCGAGGQRIFERSLRRRRSALV